TCPPPQIALQLARKLPTLVADILLGAPRFSVRLPLPGRQGTQRCLSYLPTPYAEPDFPYAVHEPHHNHLALALQAPGCSAIRQCSMCTLTPSTVSDPARTNHEPHCSSPVFAL